MITAIVGIMFWGCFGPLPGIAAVVMGLVALSQIKKTPEKAGGKPYAITGIVIGGVVIVFYLLLVLWLVFGGIGY